MIFALESSCDETAAALFDPVAGLTGEWIYSQIALHEKHGGVVPELAAREHLRHFAPLIESAMAGSPAPVIASVAVTCGPGLAPCLALGVAAAKALSMAWKVPLAGVNHLRGHVWSPFIALQGESPATFAARSAACFPHLSLLVSGGHTLLAAVESDRSIKLISSTRDDAAGEALDKGAKLLGLGYPGGPLLEKRAIGGNSNAFDFPRGLERRGEMDFSFSGLKTSLRYTVEKLGPEAAQVQMDDLCASYQEAVVDSLVRKTGMALASGHFKSLGLSGGVARNTALRARLAVICAKAKVEFLPARLDHCGDNAAMIAFAAWMDPDGTNTSGLDLGIEPGLGLQPAPSRRTAQV